MNRLRNEASPYLRQHADNPVDWYPWGDDAFEQARCDDKPVLLSVGYSACHWCHVMAHESFEDAATAAVMNDLFVNIKVDREERPDVDSVYMDAVQTLAGQGGWPMTVFMTPDGRPFWAGTYFPPSPRHGMPSFTDVLRAVHDAWTNKRAELLAQADQVTTAVQTRSTGGFSAITLGAPGVDVEDPLEVGIEMISATHDDRLGGFGNAPKFPQPSMVELMLLGAHYGNDDARRRVLVTLDAMASGGIYDHVGGGFSRYSVDDQWLVPHFEKMLYDQAGFISMYTHGAQLTGEPRLAQVVGETVDYVLRDLRLDGGGLASAEDADSEGHEGLFYTWTPEELRAVLGEHADAAIEWYGVRPGGNFEGRSILFRPARGDIVRPPEIEAARAALFEARSSRIRPGLDDKVVTEWNAMTFAALADAGAAFGREDWVAAATEVAEFLLTNLRSPDGRWLRAWQAEAGARHAAVGADYAALVDAFTRLAEASGEARWIHEAVTAADALLELFWDRSTGGILTVGRDAEALVANPKETFDGATPSANSTAALALARLASLTGDVRYEEHAAAIIRALPLSQHPGAFTRAVFAGHLLAAGLTEVVIPGTGPVALRLLATFREDWHPTAVLAWGEPFESELWAGRDEGYAYVCRHFACDAPTSDPSALEARLHNV
ncbi:MAG TPA: thioredoxin domain-containing protein [Acidimicrobiales bacterium]|nr:thioredoxin domain-containing protein [Acidimicrobiales bacterium]